jgi:diaminopimelate decarboxylase
MDHFHTENGHMQAEQADLAAIAAQHGTPCYVYSRATLERHWRVFDEALASHPHLICYAVKANSSLAVLQVLARLGSGFDVLMSSLNRNCCTSMKSPRRLANARRCHCASTLMLTP